MKVPDPLTEYDEAEAAARQDAEAREQRWTAFVADVRRWGPDRVVRCVASALTDKPTPRYVLDRIVYDFSETEGWHGVLSAIARAMREAEQDAAEVERRR